MPALECPDASTAKDHATQRGTWQGRVAAHGGALLLFTLLTVTCALQVALHPANAVAPDLIDPVYNVWAVASANHNAATWPDGLWSFFHANIFYPAPHASSYVDVFVGLLPLSLPLHLLIRDPVILTNVLVALAFVLSAYGAFLLGYELTGHYAAALVAGLVFGFCPLRSEHIGHLTIISTQWMVAATFCLVRAWRSQRWRWWTLAGLGLGLSAVTMLYYLAYLALPLAFVGVLLRTSWTKRRAQGALLAGAIAAALIVPFVIPYLIRHAAIGPRYGSGGNTNLMSFLQVLPGRPIDSLLLPVVPYQMMQPNHGLFPGFVAVALALVAWRWRRGRLWTAFALACAVVALGPRLQIDGHVLPLALPYSWLSAAVPHFRLFRDPVRATSGFYLGLAIAAAWGAHHVLAGVRTPARRALLGAGLVGLVALELWSPVPTATLPPIPAGEYWLADQPHIRVILELPITNQTPLDWQRQTEIMYDSTVHWKALINGAASVDPVGMAQRRAILATYPSRAAFTLLRRLHVDAVVLRLGWLSASQRTAAQAACHVAYRDHAEEICVGPWRA
jgi:Dolichyl-phosphate-mannose-protein mannosyltransferase